MIENGWSGAGVLRDGDGLLKVLRCAEFPYYEHGESSLSYSANVDSTVVYDTPI